MTTIGFLELNSIAKGILAADEMIKAAEIELIKSRPTCPGKYQILVSGEVSAVEASLDAGRSAASSNVIDHLILPRIHPQVIAAFQHPVRPEQFRALGVMEFFSITAAIAAADAAVKAAAVTLLKIHMGTAIGGKAYVVITGDVSAVTAACKAGCQTAEGSGMLLDNVVIPNPDKAILEQLF